MVGDQWLKDIEGKRELKGCDWFIEPCTLVLYTMLEQKDISLLILCVALHCHWLAKRNPRGNDYSAVLRSDIATFKNW